MKVTGIGSPRSYCASRHNPNKNHTTPDGITLGSDTEKFGFDTIFHVPVLGSENTVERLFQQLAIIEPVDGRICWDRRESKDS